MSPDTRQLYGAIAVTRFGLGARPSEIATAAGDPRGWLLQQIRRDGADQPEGFPLPLRPAPRPRQEAVLAPGEAADPARTLMDTAAPLGGALRPATLTFSQGQPLMSMQAAFETFAAYRRAAQADKGDPAARRADARPVLEEAGEEILARARLAATTPAGFRERWTLFWANHFTMAAKALPEAAAAGPFEREAIRPHVFGRFETLLIASTRHPGMLLYLDQAQSIGPNSLAASRRAGKAGLNENLAREVLELHTVGADAGYSQSDVTEFARALTGWSMGGANAPPGQEGAFLYRAAYHEPGARTVMGRTYPDGDDQAVLILKALAADPRTAARLARKIAVHFVADDPPPALTARLTQAYLQSGGDLSAVAQTLVAAPEAWVPEARKFKTPYEFLVSSYRAADRAPQNPATEIVQPLTALGMRPFSAPQPNGWSELAVDWAAPDALVKRLAWAQSFAAASAPPIAPAEAARAVLGERLGARTLTAVARAETRSEAFALLLMSPEFQRR